MEIIIKTPNIVRGGTYHYVMNCPKTEFGSWVLSPVEGALKWIKTLGNLQYLYRRLIFLNSRI
jgi:hypothetical protein